MLVLLEGFWRKSRKVFRTRGCKMVKAGTKTSLGMAVDISGDFRTFTDIQIRLNLRSKVATVSFVGQLSGRPLDTNPYPRRTKSSGSR
jgi:hypothetical protein